MKFWKIQYNTLQYINTIKIYFYVHYIVCSKIYGFDFPKKYVEIFSLNKNLFVHL